MRRLSKLLREDEGSGSLFDIVQAVVEDLYDGIVLDIQTNGAKTSVVIRINQDVLDEGSIAERGYWLGNMADSQHRFDRGLCRELIRFFSSVGAKTVVDFGCGSGDYVAKIRSGGIPCDGYDGNPATPELSHGLCYVRDLSKPVSGLSYDWVLSLEVGEHIPRQYETIFLDNLHRANTSGMVLSWAVEHQDGHGHVNERNNDYIIQKLKELGYTFNREQSQRLRDVASLWWFKDTLMVFDRNTNSA